MAKDIVKLFPKHKLYVEGFGGAAHVLFAKGQTGMEVYNDIHHCLYLFFKLIREGNEELIRKIQLTPYSREEFESSKDWRNEPDEIERVRKFYCATVQSVNNVGNGWSYVKESHGRSMSLSVSRFLTSIDVNLVNAVERLRTAQIDNLDILELLDKYDSTDTLFYLDPPYVDFTRKSLNQYEHEMTIEQHQAMVKRLLTIKGKVVLSGYDNEVYKDLLDAGWTKQLLGEYAKYSQKGNIGVLDKAQEFVWINYNPQKKSKMFDIPE